MKNKILKNWLLIVISAGCLLGCVLSYAVREKQHSNVSFIPASNEPSDCMHIGDCRENQIPRSLGHCKFDTLLLEAGFLTGPSIESSQLWVDAPEEITLQNDNFLGYRIKQNSEKINRSNFLEYSIINYPEIEFDDEEANKEMGVKINKLFYEKTMLHYDEKLEQEVNAFYSCDYFVSFADENFISIYFVESISAGMSSVTTYEDAITISLKTGDMVSLGNFGNINKIMEEIYNYKGIIYTDRVFEVEDWEKNKKKFIEQWEEREDACYYGYYLYNGRIGILFDYYQTGRVRMGLEFQGIAASKEEKQEEKVNTSIDIMMEDDMPELENKADEISFEENSYFFNNNHVYLKANAIYDDMIHSKFAEEAVCAEIHFIKQYEQGNLYKLAIEPLGGLTDERLNIYFYVTSEKIYRLWSHVYQDDKVITFYDDDELLTKVLDTDEKLINNGQIVCQNEEIQSESKEGDLEFHFGISRMENQIEYSSCTITPNGEIDYFENFRWEEGKGLIEFCSGYRAEREPLYLTEITQISEGRYRRLMAVAKHIVPDE